MEYKRLGEYIEPVDERNSKLEIKLSQGICNEKYFQDPRQVAENSAADKIVRRGYFAYNRATTRNGEKISIAYREGPDCTVSSAYQVFRIKDEEKLNPKYLLMWYKRPDFDKYARFRSHGSAHEFFEYEEMCNVRIPLPSIERQREIVAEYETLTNRIRLNNQMIQHLEATAQALYRKTFVDNIDKENLPEGWNFSTLGEVFDITIGRTPPRAEEKWFCRETDKENNFPWVSIADMNNGMYVLDTRERLTKEAVDWFKIPIVPPQSVLLSFKMTVGRVCITTETTLSNEAIAHFVFKDNTQIREYLYMFLKNIDYKTIGGTSSITEAINTNMIKTMLIIMPSDDVTQKFHEQLLPVFSAIYLKQKENEKLTELQSLLLARMGR